MLTRDAWRLTMRTMILAIGTVIAALSIHAGPASAQNYPWCAHRGESTNCGFGSYEPDVKRLVRSQPHVSAAVRPQAARMTVRDVCLCKAGLQKAEARLEWRSRRQQQPAEAIMRAMFLIAAVTTGDASRPSRQPSLLRQRPVVRGGVRGLQHSHGGLQHAHLRAVPTADHRREPRLLHTKPAVARRLWNRRAAQADGQTSRPVPLRRAPANRRRA
jgi:hypothetical protein